MKLFQRILILKLTSWKSLRIGQVDPFDTFYQSFVGFKHFVTSKMENSQEENISNLQANKK